VVLVVHLELRQRADGREGGRRRRAQRRGGGRMAKVVRGRVDGAPGRGRREAHLFAIHGRGHAGGEEVGGHGRPRRSERSLRWRAVRVDGRGAPGTLVGDDARLPTARRHEARSGWCAVQRMRVAGHHQA